MEHTSEEINFLLVDTYEIKNNQIPRSKRKFPTVIIENGKEFDGHRIYNPEFVKTIREQTVLYSAEYRRINIFATTNTNHNKSIIINCFKNADRTGFTSISVFQSTKGIFNFNKCYKVL